METAGAQIVGALATVACIVLVPLWALRARSARRARAAPAVRLLDTPAPKAPGKLLVERDKWSKQVPPWIHEGRGFFGRFPPLDQDPLFMDNDDPCLLPVLPSPSTTQGRGAAIICPGGNYEFLTPGECQPIACYFAEHLGIPVYVLKYRLLPEFGLPEMLQDFAAAVREARRHSNDGPVVTFGFSAGAHLSAAGCAAAAASAGAERPDAQVLCYPSLDATEWLVRRLACFVRTDCNSPQVRSLAEGPGSREQLLLSSTTFVKPPPTFMVASTQDDVCFAAKHADRYAKAARYYEVEMDYMKGPYGPHGFGLQSFWAKPCIKWLRSHGFGQEATTGSKT